MERVVARDNVVMALDVGERDDPQKAEQPGSFRERAARRTGSGDVVGDGLAPLLAGGCALGGVQLGLAEPLAFALDLNDVGMVDDAFDEGGGAGGVGEDGL